MSGGAAPVVLAAPSGAGKTTLARRLVADDEDFVFSVSATTRAPRGSETNGIDYHFLDREGFEARARGGGFAEWAEVHGELYGTPRAEIERAASEGHHVVLDIDVQGARQIRDRVPDAKLIFVLPPDVPTLLARLGARGTEGAAQVARRLRTALEELQAVEDFDYVVVNDDLERCLDTIRAIVRGEVGEEDAGAVEIDPEAFRKEIEGVLRREYAEHGGTTS